MHMFFLLSRIVFLAFSVFLFGPVFFLIFTILDCLFLFSFNLFGSIYFCLLFWMFRSLKKESILKMTAYPKYRNNFHLLTWTTTTYEREKSRYNIVISRRAINILVGKIIFIVFTYIDFMITRSISLISFNQVQR